MQHTPPVRLVFFIGACHTLRIVLPRTHPTRLASRRGPATLASRRGSAPNAGRIETSSGGAA
eukprot:390471-Pyramimonas_sp.AAC.1